MKQNPIRNSVNIDKIQLVQHDFCDDYDLERSDSNSRSDMFRFLEHSAPNVNGLFSRLAPSLEQNLVITLLGLKLSLFCQTKTNTQHIDSVRCEQLNSEPVQSKWISPSNVHIVLDRFPSADPNRSGIM